MFGLRKVEKIGNLKYHSVMKNNCFTISKTERKQILALCLNALEGSPDSADKLRLVAERLNKQKQKTKNYNTATFFGERKKNSFAANS